MKNILEEIKYDMKYLKSHTLQPKWFKILKIFILIGFVSWYYVFFGVGATILFFTSFLILSILVHFTYRFKTNRWTRSWLDFIITEENGQKKTKGIGKYYYSALILNAVISFIASQVLK